ncbi:pentatricopeptide repeat-containing protein At1g80880, mitochondrial-like [Rutidosis leptorrhynchoides]|uniref:pentatricopeptide repeat-containing protein At1g80880, mitochondrial-like n=1 Tax=Rutidosis leptorrhynchoides TaxID=125765 RepID=UPI003A997A8D
MFSAYLSRTINQRIRSHRPFPFSLTLQTTQHDSSSSFYLHSTNPFSKAFRRTVGTQSHNLNYRHFSTFNPSTAPTLYETINFKQLTKCTNESTKSDVIVLVKLLRSRFNPEEGESLCFLDGSGINPSKDLIVSVIWELKDEWKLAFLVFKWGQKWKCDDEKAWSLMIWVLGNHKKFNTAWCLIKDLYQSSMDTQRPMFIMIDRYAAANEPAEAIRAFQIMEKFKLSPDQKAFYALLDTLCKHGNVEEAEEFMNSNSKLFPLETEGFNVILNGWCNIYVDIVEAKRVWKEMDKCQVIPDEYSYTHMISCFSKVNNLFDSLRVYDEMKKRGWRPNKTVYNSLVYVLAHENCHEEALRILDKMKEMDLNPDSNAYNLLIRPLCKAGKLEDARSMLSRMLEENVNPTIDTYHAFLEGKDSTVVENLELLERMMKSGNGPNKDTLFILLDKFLQLNEVDNALKIWLKMKEYEVLPDSAHYVMMVDGLVRNGLIAKARELRAEMILYGVKEDPKITKMLKDTSQNEESTQTREIKKMGIRNVKHDATGVRVHHGKKWFHGKRSRT